MKAVLRSLSIMFILLLCGTAAFAGIRKGPYLLFEGSNAEMAVHWQTDGNETNTIRWGTDTSYGMGNTAVGTYGSDYQHQYTITGLQPGTTYYYQVDGYGSGSFRTAPADSATAVKILAYGDSRSNPGNHEPVAERMRAAYGADPAYQTILLHDGDFVGSDSESNWTAHYFVSESTYPQMHALQSEIPMVGARGNHEDSGAVYRKYFPYPYVADHYWSFDYGPVHFIVLDTYASFSSGSAQYNWLVNDLASTAKPWKILMAHPPGWGAGTHGNNSTVQNDIHPLLLQYGVDLYINGHNHNYARALVDGLNYVTTGGGGASLYTPDPSYPNIVTVDKSFHYTEIDIQNDTLTMVARRADGSEIETINVTHGAGGNQPPAADAGPDQSVTDSDDNGSEAVALDGTGSTDPDGAISSYVWKEGSTQIATGATPTVTLGVGSHTLTLTVTDDEGAVDTDTVVVTVNAAGGSGSGTTVTSQVSSGDDDAEENETGGGMYLTSSDLELVADGSKGNQHVGMRFNNVNVPQGAIINNAYIQFTVDEASTGAASLTIKGQAADNAATFTSAAYDVTSRPVTNASVAWSPVDWNTVGAAGADQQTPDLKSVVQEIVNRAGWAQNNSMAIIVEGTGKRTAESFNGSAANAPKLVIDYSTGAPSNQPPVANAGPDQNVTDSDGNGSESVTLNGSGSSDPDGTIASYVWAEGGNQIATGATPAVTLAVGSHTITLTVTDDAGATASDTVVVAVNAGGGGNPTTVSSRVATGNDDAEEYETGGTMYLTSSDLELVADGSKGNQHVGMRFADLGIPQGATITNAYVQFTVDEVNTGATSLTIRGQAADNAATFSSTAYDITSRATTGASVSWAPAAWSSVGAAGADQQTPDLKNIVQEIVNRAGWSVNNGLTIIIEGTGERTAESYNGSASNAPMLVVTYQ